MAERTRLSDAELARHIQNTERGHGDIYLALRELQETRAAIREVLVADAMGVEEQIMLATVRLRALLPEELA